MKNKKCNSLFIIYNPHTSKGFGLVEVLIASAILSASLIVLVATSQISLRLTKESVEQTQAGFLAEEGVEVVRVLRDTSWSSRIAPLSSDVSYYPSFATTTQLWTLGTSSSLVYGTFTRTVTLGDVYRRNADSEIVASSSADAKTLDTDTKKVTVQVSWSARTVEMETYITNLFQN